MPIQPFPETTVEGSGRVLVHKIEYNLAAKNGAWNAYQLVTSKGEVEGWFVSQSDVEPQQEITKILDVSGPDRGGGMTTWMNTEDSRKAGVFLINRYDWLVHVDRSLDEIKVKLKEGSAEWKIDFRSLGIVDFNAAKAMVRK